jgi:hypothetical protein
LGQVGTDFGEWARAVVAWGRRSGTLNSGVEATLYQDRLSKLDGQSVVRAGGHKALRSAAAGFGPEALRVRLSVGGGQQ